MQDESLCRKHSLCVECKEEHKMDEFEVYRRRAYSCGGGCLPSVHQQGTAGTQPVSPRLLPITDSASDDDSGVSDVTCSPSPNTCTETMTKQQRRSTLPLSVRSSMRKKVKTRKTSCPDTQVNRNDKKPEKPKFFVYDKNITIPCGKATRVETSGNGSTQKHRVRLVSEGSIEKNDLQQLKTVNFLLNSTEESDHKNRGLSESSRSRSRSRRSLPNEMLHTGQSTSRTLRTPSPSNPTKTSLLQSKARRPSELPMESSNSSSFRPRTRSMPARSRACKIQQNRSMTVAEAGGGSGGGGGGPTLGDLHQSIMNTGDDLETETKYRVRSFSTSGKTVVNRGDSFKSFTTSSGHASMGGSTTSIGGEDSYFTHSRTSSVSSEAESDLSSCGIPPPVYKVLMLGAHDVGKSSLAQQFTTSEYMGHVDTLPDDGNETIVSVQLDEEESFLYFVNANSAEVTSADDDVDAYVIVYSVTDPRSFRRAWNIVDSIKRAMTHPVALIVVANKADIVRNRIISQADGKEAAWSLGCKYVEVSAVLNHKVDELLVGILSQIKLNSERPMHHPWPLDSICLPHHTGCMTRLARGLFSKLLNRNVCFLSSCDNLLEL